jgi:pyrroloquinoline quinone biosynthesis protein B
MRIRILGSAAGGGVPQWNCRCSNCEAARTGSPSVRPRTQSSVAVSADGRDWFLLNVAPDIRQQILAFPPLGPPEGQERGQGIAGCVLTDAELDHTAGLLLLREGGPFTIFSTTMVRHWLRVYLPVERLLSYFAKPDWVLFGSTPLLLARRGQDCQAMSRTEAGWQPAPRSEGIVLSAFGAGPHVPRFVTTQELWTHWSVIGLVIEDLRTGAKLVYAPCVGSISEPLVRACREADAVLLDGTFWSEDEPLRFGTRTALEMGHIPVSGPNGSLAWLADLAVRQRMYIHINNTNPMLNETGAEYQLVNSHGVRVGADGDMLEL